MASGLSEQAYIALTGLTLENTTSGNGAKRARALANFTEPLADLYILSYTAATAFIASSATAAECPALQSRASLSLAALVHDQIPVLLQPR